MISLCRRYIETGEIPSVSEVVAATGMEAIRSSDTAFRKTLETEPYKINMKARFSSHGGCYFTSVNLIELFQTNIVLRKMKQA